MISSVSKKIISLRQGFGMPSAEDKIARGKRAIDAFSTYRAMKNESPSVADSARKVLQENMPYFGYGYLQSRNDLIPPVSLVYWAFRAMVGLGAFFLLLMTAILWFECRQTLVQKRWLQHIALWTMPLIYIAGQAGWIVAEVGRQPWTIQGLLPVNAAVSSVSVGAVQTTFFIFVAIFTLFLIIEIRIMLKAVQKGPEIEHK